MSNPKPTSYTFSKEDLQRGIDVRVRHHEESVIYMLTRFAQGADRVKVARELNTTAYAVQGRISRLLLKTGTLGTVELLGTLVRDGKITPEMLRTIPKPNPEWFFKHPKS
jgi:hypothetical protein